MSKQFIKTSLVWGFLLWLFGYILGIALFTFVPATLLGWVIMPAGIAITLWVINTKVSPSTKEQAIFLGASWTLIAVICDYLFLVQIFHPVDGYYKLDVYLYYFITLIMPLLLVKIKKYEKTQ